MMTFSCSNSDLGKAGRKRPSGDSKDHVPSPDEKGGNRIVNGTISSSRETQPRTAAGLWSFLLRDHHPNDAGSLTMHRKDLQDGSEGSRVSEFIK